MADAATSPYLVLARKYRPRDFTTLVGQDAMVQTLGNAFKQNRIHHAFILTGVRGVGKTTTARILADQGGEVARAIFAGKDQIGRGRSVSHPACPSLSVSGICGKPLAHHRPVRATGNRGQPFCRGQARRSE